MNNNQKWVNQQETKSRILEARKLVDRNLRDYLILQLNEMEKAVYVFASQVPEHRWIDLTEGKEYTFTIAENDKGYFNLLDFDYF